MPGNAAGIKRSETSHPFSFGGRKTVWGLRGREIREGVAEFAFGKPEKATLIKAGSGRLRAVVGADGC